jgi:type II secretory pathway predicted ATPase ExeA
MYYEYWGLNKPPFDNVPDPSMYVDCHASMERAIAETLFGIEEGDECIAVIVGDVGLGKTMSLRMIIDSLEPDKYRMALVTNPGISFVQILREIIGQLTGTQCTEKRKVDLLETFNKLLFETLDEGKRVLIFIDEANAIAPANLESLRLLTNMQQDQHNLFTMVLAGQIELARRLEHPKRANLFQRIGTYSRIDKIASPELVKTYVEARLKYAGGKKKVFSDDAIIALYEHSEQGVPRLINKIAKLSLKAGETNGFDTISGELVNRIGERFQRLTRPAIGKRRPRKKTDEKVVQEDIRKAEYDQDKIVSDAIPAESETGLTGAPEEARLSRVQAAAPEVTVPELTLVEEPVSEPIVPEEPVEEEEEDVVPEAAPEVTVPELTLVEEPVSEPMVPEEMVEEEEKDVAQAVASEVTIPEVAVVEEPVSEPVVPEETIEEEEEEEDVAQEVTPEEMVEQEGIVEKLQIGTYVVAIEIPSTVIEQAKFSTREQQVKVAGSLAAQILQKNPQLIASHVNDPVHVWGEIRTAVLNQFG